MDRLYVIVRDDLRPGQQMAQAIHAAHSFAFENPDQFRAWIESSGYLVVLSVPDEDGIYEMISKAISADIDYYAFREADFGDELTAVALQPGNIARELCKGLPLALKGCSKGPGTSDSGGSQDPDVTQQSATLTEGNRWPA